MRFGLFGWVAGLALGFGVFFFSTPFPDALDVPFHLYFSNEFSSALAEAGDLPDWDAAVYGGRGTAAFRFYAPGAYLVGSGFRYLGFSLPAGLKCTVLFFFLVGAFGLRRWMGMLGLSGSFPVGLVLWFGAPVVAIHLFRVFLFQNICAMCLMPWVLASFEETFVSGWGGVPKGAIACGAVAWIHLPSALMMGYLGALIVLGRGFYRAGWKHVTQLTAMACLGLSLAGPYILEAVPGVGSLNFDAHMAIQQPWEHPGFLDDAIPVKAVSSPNLRLAMRIGLAALILLVVLTLWGNSIDVWKAFPYLLAAGIGILVTFRFSLPLWRILPGWSSLQYPWRWVWPVTILAIPFAAAWSENRGLSPAIRRVGWVALGLWIATTVWIQAGSQNLPANWYQKALDGNFHYPCEYTPRTCRLADCQLPHPLPAKVGPYHQFSPKGGGANLKVNFSSRSEVLFSADVKGGDGTLFCRTHFDPFWRLLRLEDGKQIEVSSVGECGQISAVLPPGKGTFRLFRVFSPRRVIGWLLGVLAALILAILSRPQRI